MPGQDPKKLGIPSTYTEAYEVVLDKPYEFLKSTAKEVPAFLTGDKGTYKGGGIQLFNTELKSKTHLFKKIK